MISRERLEGYMQELELTSGRSRATRRASIRGDNLNELQASLDAIGVALSQHYPILAKYRN